MALVVFLGGTLAGNVMEIDNEILGAEILVEQSGEKYVVGAFTFKEDAYLVAVIDGEKPMVILQSYVETLVQNWKSLNNNDDSNGWGSQYDYN